MRHNISVRVNNCGQSILNSGRMIVSRLVLLALSVATVSAQWVSLVSLIPLSVYVSIPLILSIKLSLSLSLLFPVGKIGISLSYSFSFLVHWFRGCILGRQCIKTLSSYHFYFYFSLFFSSG